MAPISIIVPFVIQENGRHSVLFAEANWWVGEGAFAALSPSLLSVGGKGGGRLAQKMWLAMGLDGWVGKASGRVRTCSNGHIHGLE